MTPEKPSFQALNQRQLAEAHGVSVRSIQFWSDGGMPRNADGSYDLAATIRWRCENTGRSGQVDLAGRTYRRPWR